jgi:hypothetical protein
MNRLTIGQCPISKVIDEPIQIAASDMGVPRKDGKGV